MDSKDEEPRSQKSLVVSTISMLAAACFTSALLRGWLWFTNEKIPDVYQAALEILQPVEVIVWLLAALFAIYTGISVLSPTKNR